METSAHEKKTDKRSYIEVTLAQVLPPKATLLLGEVNLAPAVERGKERYLKSSEPEAAEPQETKLSEANNRVYRRLWGGGSFAGITVESEGRSGGLILATFTLWELFG
ncbi:hypothetical protein DITRI_Ditri14bG0006000 [Diplodiscus trichospermus]